MEQTTDTGLVAAKALYRLDWDQEGTVSVHLPTRIALKALRDRGWHIVTYGERAASETPGERERHTAGKAIRDGVDPESIWAVVAPTGERFWHVDEALQYAIAAEVL